MAEKIICVVGPTACGKTKLGVLLAKRYDGEVVSADSMQIYKGMSIGTAAPTQEELLANLGDGLYLTEVSGLHAGANPISGDFSLLSRGFEIKGGRVVRAVEEFTVAGNFYQLLKDITDVGGDLLFEASPIGSPSVLVKRLDVAGA